jgi:hypothetical protein
LYDRRPRDELGLLLLWWHALLWCALLWWCARRRLDDHRACRLLLCSFPVERLAKFAHSLTRSPRKLW